MVFLRTISNDWRKADWSNETDVDFIRQLPYPSTIVLIDRADGKKWVLTYNITEPSADGLGYISITDALPQYTDANIVEYEAYGGPTIPGYSHTLRLFVRSGILGFDVEPGTVLNATARAVARKGKALSFRDIFLASTAAIDLNLAWKPYP